MIKGHAVIELKDEATGEIQKKEHDNMITNGLKYCMTPWLGKFSYANLSASTYQSLTTEDKTKRKNENKSMMNHLMGGIFLFENPLTENVENVAFPRNNPLTGKASWDAYTGMDTSRGSYNEEESGLQEDGSYRHVWDFTTHQANGQISALALTTYIGGICGNGYAEWDFSTETSISADPLIKLGSIKIDNTYNYSFPIFCPGENAICYMKDPNNISYSSNDPDKHFSNSGKLLLTKKRFPLIKISPFYDYYNQYMEEEIEISVPAEFMAYAQKASSCLAYQSDSYVYVIKENYINPSGAAKILRIKKADFQSEIFTLTNNTTDQLYMSERNTVFTDRYLFVFGSNVNFYRIDLTNNETVLIHNLGSLWDTVYLNGFIYNIKSPKAYCINEDTLEMKAHPYFGYHLNSIRFYGFERIAPNIYLMGYSRNTYNDVLTYCNVGILSNTLMTINNLSSPVTKTATQSMKITYTLQEVEDQ